MPRPCHTSGRDLLLQFAAERLPQQVHERRHLHRVARGRVDLLAEGFDCVVRIGAQPDQSVVARHLGDFSMINCASPAYLERYGVPQTLEDLAQHRLVHYVGVLGSRSEGFVYEQDGQVHRVPMAGSVTVNSTDAYESACLGGFGLIQVPRTGMNTYLDTGGGDGAAAIHRARDGHFTAVREAAAALATTIWQARQAPGASVTTIDGFIASPYQLGNTLIAKVRGLIAPYLSPMSMLG